MGFMVRFDLEPGRDGCSSESGATFWAQMGMSIVPKEDKLLIYTVYFAIVLEKYRKNKRILRKRSKKPLVLCRIPACHGGRTS